MRTAETLELAALVARLDDEADGPGWAAAARPVAEVLRAARDLPAAFATDDRGLAAELAPWAAAAAREADAGLAAIRLLQGSRPVATIDATGDGRAAAPDAEWLVQAVFLLVFTWSGARGNHESVFGPRFAIYPAVVQTATGRPAVDIGLTLLEDGNAIDRLCRVALREYERWREGADETVRVFVDGDARAVDGDGTFDGRGETALLRSGRLCTRVRAGDTLPSRDRRLR